MVFTTALCIYQEATSAYAYTSSITAVSGSPVWSRGACDGDDEVGELILSWAEGVTNLDSDNLDAVGPFECNLHSLYLFIHSGAYLDGIK